MNNEKFLLITPAKNEENFLPSTIKSVLRNSIKPILWVIIDDGSTDKTNEIIRYYSKEYPFIKPLFILENFKRDLNYRYSYICKMGFEYAIKYTHMNNIHWNYIGILDADISVENNYFEKIIHFMKNDCTLGICSGVLYSYNKIGYYLTPSYMDIPIGGARIWRKDCFLKTGGYQITQAPDSVANAKAILYGWKTKQIKNCSAFQKRETSSAEGVWKGYFNRGREAYYVYLHPLLIFGNIFSYILSKNILNTIPYLIGYFTSFISKSPRSNDLLVKYFFSYIRIRARLRKL